MTIETTYPAVVSIPILMVLAGIVYVLYYRPLKQSGLKFSRLIYLTVSRFLILSIIGFLLLNPFIKKESREVQKPIIIFAVDNSQSMMLSQDSIFLKDSLVSHSEKMISKFTTDFEVEKIQFGDSVNDLSFSFSDKTTNFNSLFDVFNSRFFNQNIGALIIVSDGIYNQGNDPSFLAQNSTFPIYTVPIGDTIINTDIEITKVDFNTMVQKGSKSPILVGISAVKCANFVTEVTLSHRGKILESRDIIINSDDYYSREPFYLLADSTGLEEFVVTVKPKNDELNVKNNVRKIFVEVEDKKRTILLLFNGYHPDIAVFEQIIKQNQAFKLDISSPKSFNGNIDDYDLVILHQLPSNENNLQNLMPELNRFETPMLFVLGGQSNIPVFNNLGLPFKVIQKGNLYDDVFGTLNSNFTLFNVSISQADLNEMPPLLVPFGELPSSINANTLLQQKIGQVQSQKPLWAFSDLNKQKIGIIMGEGIWRWRILEYKKFRDHSLTDELITKTLQYMSVKNSRDSFIVEYPKLLTEGENLSITAKPFNQSNELIKGAMVKLQLFDSIGNVFPHQFNETDFDYHLNLIQLGVGRYNFEATVEGLGKGYVKKGTFIIHHNQIEQTDLIANYRSLFKLSEISGGKMVDKQHFDSIYKYISQNQDIGSLVYSQKNLEPLINLYLIFVILLLLLSIEWFLRKYWGLI